MPKQRITREMVVEAAFELARMGGMEALLVKNIAAKLGCSVQPVYGYCENIAQLRQAVIERTGLYLQDFVRARLDPQDRFRSTGYAHVAFAREEPQLYRLYFLRPRAQTTSLAGFYQAETDPLVAPFIAENRNLTLEQAQKLHLQMLIYTAGMSFLLTSLGEHTRPEQVAALLEEALCAFYQTIQKGEST